MPRLEDRFTIVKKALCVFICIIYFYFRFTFAPFPNTRIPSKIKISVPSFATVGVIIYLEIRKSTSINSNPLRRKSSSMVARPLQLLASVQKWALTRKPYYFWPIVQEFDRWLARTVILLLQPHFSLRVCDCRGSCAASYAYATSSKKLDQHCLRPHQNAMCILWKVEIEHRR